jgi:hypothetical protein
VEVVGRRRRRYGWVVVVVVVGGYGRGWLRLVAVVVVVGYRCRFGFVWVTRPVT